MSQRTRRIDHLLREEISAIIRRDLQDPRVGFVTITGIDVAPDLHHATVWASILGSEAERRETLQVLGRAMPYVRHQLGSLHLRRIPELHLREDDSAARSTRVMRILDSLEPEAGEESTTEGTADRRTDEAADRPTDGPTSGPTLKTTAGPTPAPEELPALPTPRKLNEPATLAAEESPEPPLPPGYRRHADREALRRARQRRGR